MTVRIVTFESDGSGAPQRRPSRDIALPAPVFISISGYAAKLVTVPSSHFGHIGNVSLSPQSFASSHGAAEIARPISYVGFVVESALAVGAALSMNASDRWNAYARPGQTVRDSPFN